MRHFQLTRQSVAWVEYLTPLHGSGILSIVKIFIGHGPDRVKQSVGHLTHKSEVLVSPSAYSRGAVVSYWRKYVHEVLVNRLGGLGLPRKRVVRLTDRPDMTLDVYRGRKTTTQQQHHRTRAFVNNLQSSRQIKW